MDIHRRQGVPVEAAVTLVCAGEIDSPKWQEFRREIVECPAESGTTMVVLDLAEVTFFDSSAVRALIGARAELEPRGITIHIDRTSPIVHKVLDLTGLYEHFGPSGLTDEA